MTWNFNRPLRLVPVLLCSALGFAGCESKPAVEKPTAADESVATPGKRGERKRGGGIGSRKNRGRLCGVYVDGKVVAFLSYAELPEGLTPIYLEEERFLPFKPGEKRETEIRQVPRYRLLDYLQKLRLPLEKIKSVMLHHGRGHVAEVTGEALRGEPDLLLFRFGGDTFGKAIPVFRPGLEVNRKFDHMVAVSVYIDKAPPKRNATDHLTLDGDPVDGIPYFGPPVRNGTRVYLDDRLVTILKRRTLRSNGAKPPTLASTLEREGIAVESAKIGFLVSQEVRSPVLEATALLNKELRALESGQLAAADKAGPTELDAVLLYSKKRVAGAPGHSKSGP